MFTLAAVCFPAACLVDAQSVPVLRSGELEVTALGGFNFGGSLSSVTATAFNSGAADVEIVTPSSNGSIGFRMTASATRKLLVALEWTYIAGGRIEYTQDFYLAQPPLTTQRTVVNAHASTMDFNGGLEYLLPFAGMRRTIPFVFAGGSGLRASQDLTYAAIGDIPGSTFSGRVRTYHAAADIGAGFRYYFNEHIGFRLEGRFYKTRDLGTFGRLGFGIFYRFR